MEHHRINVTFDNATYKQIKLIADRNHCSLSEVVRQYIADGLNGDLTKSNLDFIGAMIREQMEVILSPAVERLAALSTKTCIQASASAYLNAEALAKLVPLELQTDLEETYIAARRKAVIYTRQRVFGNDLEE